MIPPKNLTNYFL